MQIVLTIAGQNSRAALWVALGTVVAASAGRAYVAEGAAGLLVIDMSAPEAAAVVGSVDTPGYAGGIAVSGDHAYVGDGEAGLQVVDISVPDAPAIVGSVDTPGPAGGDGPMGWLHPSPAVPGNLMNSAGTAIHPAQAAQARALRAVSARQNPGGC